MSAGNPDRKVHVYVVLWPEKWALQLGNEDQPEVFLHKDLQMCFQGVSRVFSGCFQGVSRVCFQGVFSLFPFQVSYNKRCFSEWYVQW